ncbi:C45 family autoproteolytic acyltransferase/hydrolase [Chitinophagaceae bacterium MMS25-I14]
MRFLKKLLKVLGYTLAVIFCIVIFFCIYVWKVSDIKPPEVADTTALSLQRNNPGGSLYTIGDNWIRHSRYGLYEMYVSGKPFELGVKNGKLSQQLIMDQELAFTTQIRQMIPSPRYLKFLKYVIGFINRDLPDYINDEYKQEIYGESFAAADSFNWIGSNYSRLLNYHSAHDVGHALQNMMLVGCTSFGAWNASTADGSMLLGRNFDFWVGDLFAENKMVAFYKPEKGYRFAFITWGGFTGVVSGMNEKGLTVTINAARSKIPFSSATPVSLVAREVLQYAGNTAEAIAIAHKRKMFVSESFLIGSAADHKAIIIEKTPDTLAVYDPQQDHILCTNHYQSDFFATQDLNKQQKEKSASVYRYQRLEELLQQNYPLTPEKVAAVLRDRRGLHGADIGEGNEKAVNQLIAHHSVIFQPDSLRMWVSTQPWQLGTYVCYDLRKIFAMNGMSADREIADTAWNIAPDTFLQSNAYKGFLDFRKNKMALMQHKDVDTAQTIHGDPQFYDAYRVAGDYSREKGWYTAAIAYYRQALQHEVATINEREAIEHKIAECEKKMRH